MSVAVVEDAEVVGSGWAEHEFGGADLGDLRLTRRLVAIAGRFMEKPLASIPQSMAAWAEAKGAYRFMDNEKVEPDAILEPHRLRTTERAAEHPVVLAVGDTTTLDYTAHPKTTGLGPLSDLQHQGLHVHPTLVVTPQHVPLGLIDNLVWTRDEETFAKTTDQDRERTPIDDKESRKWICSVGAAEQLQRDLREAGSDTRVISVFDREGDIYEVLAAVDAPDTTCDLLIRAKNDRRVDHDLRRLWLTMETRPRAGTVLLHLPRTPKRWAARDAEITVRFASLTLLPPGNKKGLGPIDVRVVYACEERPPKGVKPVSWMLVTTADVETFEDACTVLSWYEARWVIELLNRVLKSGCKSEDRGLETADRLKRCLAVDLVVAWRVLYLTTVGRDTPDTPCTVIFEDDEWQSLYAYVHKSTAAIPKETPTLREVTRLIGHLGGHLGRKGDGEPGQTTMWRGLTRLTDISAGWKIGRARKAEPDASP